MEETNVTMTTEKTQGDKGGEVYPYWRVPHE